MKPSSRSAIELERGLVCVAAPGEFRAVARGSGMSETLPEPWDVISMTPRWSIVVTGIGKANAAGAVARALVLRKYEAVLNLGVAGALPADNSSSREALDIGESVVGTECVFADEGLQTPLEFQTCARMGFPLGDFEGNAVPTDAVLTRALTPLCRRAGPIATVSTCSGTDELAKNVRSRTHALAEGMEGAAVALVCHRMGVPMAELRVISNTTGAREHQRWDLPRALGELSRVSALIFS